MTRTEKKHSRGARRHEGRKKRAFETAKKEKKKKSGKTANDTRYSEVNTNKTFLYEVHTKDDPPKKQCDLSEPVNISTYLLNLTEKLI